MDIGNVEAVYSRYGPKESEDDESRTKTRASPRQLRNRGVRHLHRCSITTCSVRVSPMCEAPFDLYIFQNPARTEPRPPVSRFSFPDFSLRKRQFNTDLQCRAPCFPETPFRRPSGPSKSLDGQQTCRIDMGCARFCAMTMEVREALWGD